MEGLELRGGSIKALCELDPGCLAPEWVAHSLKSPKEQFEFFAGATFSGHQNMVGYCSLTPVWTSHQLGIFTILRLAVGQNLSIDSN